MVVCCPQGVSARDVRQSGLHLNLGGFCPAVPLQAPPLLHTTRCVAYNLRRASGRGRLTSTTMPNQAVGALRVRRSWVHAVVKTFQDKEPGREGSKEISRTGAEENWGWCGRGSEGRKPWMATP